MTKSTIKCFDQVNFQMFTLPACPQYMLLYREAKLVDAEKVLLTDHHHHQVHEESVIRLVFVDNLSLGQCYNIHEL